MAGTSVGCPLRAPPQVGSARPSKPSARAGRAALTTALEAGSIVIASRSLGRAAYWLLE